MKQSKDQSVQIHGHRIAPDRRSKENPFVLRRDTPTD